MNRETLRLLCAQFAENPHEDVAYARDLEAAGVPVRLTRACGHTHR